MEVAAWVCSVVGTVLNLSAAAYLLWGMDPDNPRYNTSALRNRGLSRYLSDQRRPLARIVAGSTLQLLGIALSLLA